jgi:hypothetical protein
VDAITESAQRACTAQARDYLDGKRLGPGTTLYFYLPPAQSWRDHQRSVICFFGSPAGKMTSSVKSGTVGTGVGV